MKNFSYLKQKKLVLLFIIALISSIFLGSINPILTQNTNTQPSLSPQELVIKEIKDIAENHVENDVEKKTNLVVEEYASNSVGLTKLEIAEIYETEHNKLTKEKQNQNPFSKLPQGWLGWLAALMLLILTLFQDWIKKNNPVGKILAWFYKKFAGTPFLRSLAVKKYQKALIEKYEKLAISFRQNRPLEMRDVYVPLRVKESKEQSNESLIEAEKALKDYSKLMVTGSPGSGKSVLLKYLTLSYAEQGLSRRFSTPFIPVLLELNTLSLSDLTVKALENQLVNLFSKNDFPNANNFVHQSLKAGYLLLLFDGLDEVIDSSRGEVVKGIKDFLDTYEKCPFIITCRTAVYKNEFYDIVNKTLEISDFNDQQIRRFLRSWKTEMPVGKSVEELLKTLDDRPQIKTLAKNPLLLTIIAYLYTDTKMSLPYSRAEFYRKTIDILSEARDEAKGVKNSYTGEKKKRVLQQLALYVQTRTRRNNLPQTSQPFQENRRILSDIEIREEVKKILPDLNLASDDVDKIIDEIIKRSGLLLRLDGGQRYQFAHQTLQEYFVAAALSDQSNKLVSYWENAPDDWGEIVKLWCGLANNSTNLIRSISVRDPLMAFECLGDTNFVEKELAEQIVNSFKDKFGHENNDRTLSAFGFVAASSSERGKGVFQFLRETLMNADSSNLRKGKAAAIALAQTNKSEAAEILGEYYAISYVNRSEIQSTVRKSLAKLGNLAIPTLTKLDPKNLYIYRLTKQRLEDLKKQILEDIKNIGTPEAAIALVPFLWEINLRDLTAWYLGSLLQFPEVEDAFREEDFSQELKNFIIEKQREKDYLPGIWHPFQSSASSNLSIITGRIAYILVKQLENNTNSDYIDPFTPTNIEPPPTFPNFYINPRTLDLTLDYIERPEIDPRLMIPVCAFAGFQGVRLPESISDNAIALLEQSVLTEDIEQKMSQEICEIIERGMNEGNNNEKWSRFLFNLPHPLPLDLLRRLIESPRRLTIDDWRNLYEEIDYQFFKSGHYWGILMVAVLLSIGAIAQIIALWNKILGNTSFSISSMLILAFSIIIFLIIVTFLMVLRIEVRSTKETLNPPLLISLGFFGIVTVPKELTRFWSKGLVWEGITVLYSSLRDSYFPVVAFAFAFAGAVAGAVAFAGAVAGAVAGAGAFAVAGAVAGAGAFAGAIAVAGAVAFAGAVAGAVAITIVVAVAVAFGYGLGIWYRGTRERLGVIRYLSVLAFPWFCWFPLVFILVSWGLWDTLSIELPFICLFWLIILGLCGYWWVRGQRLEAKARNPFKGILRN
ncbi:NACHT domain-containing protein [Crocosphaera chwakensis]|uniref:NACHT domain-containing protein n=1 Tax=Crocosphaera chwakensis CCY0110 TaxID=391612 RepID=A3IX53_9CHRO|nr:NACHT domain-containing protein [Crocosphaera chwakensis]EAZ88940.1 hypothetical protein CY0110_02552 [Crocosphaera chwakensis CCY0110]